jgi:hypothetical protein
MVRLVRTAFKEIRVLLVKMVPQVKMVPLAQLDLRESKVRRVPKANKVRLVLKENRAPQDKGVL